MEKILQKIRKGMLARLSSLAVIESKIVKPKDLQLILSKHARVFEKPIGLPPPRSHDHAIQLVAGSQPPNMCPYWYPCLQKNEIEKLVQEMLDVEVIRHSKSPYSSPVILVHKKDGSWRMCVDFRVLNKITIKDKFPISIIDELLDGLHGARFL